MVVICGRVVDAAGQPVGGAQVDLMSHDTPHRAPYVLATITTGADGVFELPRRQFDRLIVTAYGAEHAYRPRGDVEVVANGRTEIRLGDLPVGFLRELLVTAECATVVPLEPSWMGIWITIDWRGHGLLHPRIMPDGFGFLGPGDSGTQHQLMPRSPGERVFQRRVDIPPGTHDIRVTGGCGDALARVTIPTQGEVMPVHLPLAAPR